MLVLGREEDQKVLIKNKSDETIATITVVGFRGGKHVRLGFEANKEYTFIREEIAEREIKNATS